MGAAAANGRTLHVTLCEIERGVFYATYPGHGSETGPLTTYQIGTSAADVKDRIETSAHALGYETIIWKQTVTAPLFAVQQGGVRLKPGLAESNRRGRHEA
jgi:hypothetical protein